MGRIHFYCRSDQRSPGRVVRIVMMAVFGITIAAIIALIFGFVVKALWNWLMPSIFGLREINYWQAFGLTILGKILFSGLHHGHPHPRPLRSDRFTRRAERYIDRDEEMNGADMFDRFSSEEMRHYRDFWKEKGEASFEEYLRSKRVNESEENVLQ